MLIDMHTHSSALSHCCWIDYKQVIDLTLEKGLDGIVLTNHYEKSYIAKFGDVDSYIEKYINEFYTAEKYGKEVGCKVLFGIEVTMELYPRVHMLIYGVGPDFLKENPYVFDCNQEELYTIVKANKGVLVQGHPFRGGTTILDTNFLDGIEINCHPYNNLSYSKELLKIGKEKGLLVTCGGDYHAVGPVTRPKCGMYLPDEVSDHNDLREYLLSPGPKKLCIHEQDTNEWSIVNTF